MKRLFTLFIFTFSLLPFLFSSIVPGHSTALINHLNEINKEWEHHCLPSALNTTLNFETDTDRIRTHLTLVEQSLRQDHTSTLNAEQIKKRSEALDILKIYYENNCFPINHYHSVRQPYFIDNFGTACAVGHLMIETGFETLAEQIAKENNYAYISELQPKYPLIDNWATEYGFTLEELAWIQPGYPPAPQIWFAPGNGGGTNGQINVMEAYHENAEFLYIAGDFTEVDGNTANSIIAWDGVSWTTLGNGVTGSIHDMEVIFDNNLYIAGDFYLNDNPDVVNVAHWNGTVWSAVTTQNIEGPVYTIHYNGTLFIGGDFTIDVGGQTIENLAYKIFTEDSWENADGAFSVNGIVTDFDWNNQLLVAGHFSQTGTASSDPAITDLMVNGLAYWGLGNAQTTPNWTLGFSPNLLDIGAVAIEDGWLIAGSSTFDTDYVLPTAAIFTAGIWNYIYQAPFNMEDPVFMGFVKYNNGILGYGNVGTFNGVTSSGIVPMTEGSPRAAINNVVRAAESYQGYLYVAGDFTEIFTTSLNGLAYSTLEPLTSIPEIPHNLLEVYSTSEQIVIQYGSLDESLDLTIYNLNGQLIKQSVIPPGSMETNISIQNWTDGIYIYQAVSESGKMYSGKVSVF